MSYGEFIMRQITVSGKPSNYQTGGAAMPDDSRHTFTLTERWYDGTTAQYVEWMVIVPTHRELWVRKMIEKGYTVVVQANDFGVGHVFPNGQPNKGWLMLADLLIV